MVSPPTKHIAAYAVAGVGLLGFVTFTLVNSTMGYPWQLWFVDMMDGQNVKAYERPMAELPEGVVSRNMYVENVPWADITRMQVQRGRKGHAGIGAAVGGGLGAVAGAFAGVAVCGARRVAGAAWPSRRWSSHTQTVPTQAQSSPSMSNDAQPRPSS